MPVNNHAVLLKGVNDSLATMRAADARAAADQGPALLPVPLRSGHRRRPLPHLGVEGAGDHGGPARPHVSGLGVPTYVVDSPHGGGKIPLMPNYLVSASDDAVVLRNYEGMLFRYAPEDRPEARPTADTPTQGVSALLSGTRDVLVPEGTPRMARRQEHAAEAAGTQPADVIQMLGVSAAGTGRSRASRVELAAQGKVSWH